MKKNWLNSKKIKLLATGSLGTSVTFTLNSNKVTISGTGSISDYSQSTLSPLIGFKDEIMDLEILNGPSHIGNYAFYNLVSLVTATISDSITSTGIYIFYNCFDIFEFI